MSILDKLRSSVKMKLLVVITLFFVLTETNFARSSNPWRGNVRQGIKTPSMRTNASPSTSRRTLFSKTLKQNSQIKQRTLGGQSLSSRKLSSRGRQRKIKKISSRGRQRQTHSHRKSRRNDVDHREQALRCKRGAGKISPITFTDPLS